MTTAVNVNVNLATPLRKLSSATDDSPFLSDWGFTLRDLYNLCLHFYKDKQGKAVHFSYEERLKLSALNCQISHGKFNPETAPPIGVLDVIGKDRRVAWNALGDKSKADCMFEFITSVNSSTPLFKPFVEAHKRDLEERERREAAAAASASSTDQSASALYARELERVAEENRVKMEEQRQRIQDALNTQTFSQFMSYAEQQYPGNPEQQGVLIRQLQEQHYEQYMRQLYQSQLYAQAQTPTPPPGVADAEINAEAQLLAVGLKSVHISSPGPGPGDGQGLPNEEAHANPHPPGDEEEDESEGNDNSCSLAAPSMWTRKDIREFKESVKAEGGEAVIRIGQGESVTVRVPTHPEGSCLFWEFATDAYDIGFGLFFEWTDSDEPVSVQVTEETSEEDDEEDEVLATMANAHDPERGSRGSDAAVLPKDAKPNTEVIIPVYRRDAQTEVYVGSHLFPGKGVYLLKFDNSYSFWRSKTLYYRVYYTK